MVTPPTAVPAPARPYLVYAICVGSGPVVIGTYATEPEQRTAYALAKRRLQEGSYYAEEVKDFALGEDPAMRKARQPVPLEALEMFLGTMTPEARAPPPCDRNSHWRSGDAGPEPAQLEIAFTFER